MPRRGNGPRLWFDKKRHTYTIVDGRERRRTGCGPKDAKRAQEILGDYIASKHTIGDSPDPILADVLSAYASESLAGKPSEAHILYDIGHLARWWGTKRVSDISTKNSKAYVQHRNGIASARRELAFLGASIRHWHKEHGPLRTVPIIDMPPARKPRQHWMTREQAARFLWVARKTPHLARFFIIGWYTGSRRAKILSLRWSMVDFRTGIMQRQPPGVPEPRNKKAPPLRMGRRLTAHLKRWKKMDGKDADIVVHYKGRAIKNPIRTWDNTRRKAKLPAYITQHILRHTRATNMMQQGISPWEASKALGMSIEMLERTYGHHHPSWQKDAAEVR